MAILSPNCYYVTEDETKLYLAKLVKGLIKDYKRNRYIKIGDWCGESTSSLCDKFDADLYRREVEARAKIQGQDIENDLDEM